MRNLETTIQYSQLNNILLAIETGEIKSCDAFLIKEPNLPFLNHYIVYAHQDEYGVNWFFVTMSMLGKAQLLNENQLYNLALKYKFELKKHIPFDGNTIERCKAYERGLLVMGKTYKWIGANCENMYNYIHTGRTKSNQTRLFGGTAGVIGLGMMRSKNSVIKSLGVVVSIVGFGALISDLLSDFNKI